MAKPLKPVRVRDLLYRLAETLISCGITVEEAAAQFHRALLETALAENGGCQVETAKRQGMPRTTLRNQMISCGLLRPPRRLADRVSGLPQAEANLLESLPAPSPGSLSPSDEKEPFTL